MLYVTGVHAFMVPDDTLSAGIWEYDVDKVRKEIILQDSKLYPFGDDLIKKDVPVPWTDFHSYNVATHARAYADMLYKHDFDTLDGFFYEYSDDPSTRYNIFKLCIKGGLMKDKEVYKFLMHEFGSVFRSFATAGA